MLGKVADSNSFPDIHLSAISLQVTCNQIQEGRLAFAIVTHDANPICLLNQQLKVLQNRLVWIGKANSIKLDNLFPDATGFKVDFEFTVFHLICKVFFQIMKAMNPRFLLGGPGLGLPAHPREFLLVELLLLMTQGSITLILLCLESDIFLIIALVFGQTGPVQFKNPCRHIVQEIAVMGDKQNRFFGIFEKGLQPFNTINIQVVGRFIQKQEVSPSKQGLSQVNPAAQAS